MKFSKRDTILDDDGYRPKATDSLRILTNYAVRTQEQEEEQVVTEVEDEEVELEERSGVEYATPGL